MKKEKKISDTEREDEATAYEKFEDEVKKTIFNVLYVLLKDDESSHWKHIILSCSDFIQIYYFSFAIALNYPWRSDSVLYYFQTFLSFFQLTKWLSMLDLTVYLVFFYICIFIVCLVILDIVYVSYSFTKNKFTFVWPLQALRSVCGLFVTVLFLPFLETFSSIFECEKTSTGWYHHFYPTYPCWTGTHLIHAIFSVVVSVIFIVISIVVALTYFDSQSSSHDPSARVNSRADVFTIALKIVLTYLYVFFYHEEYQWFLIILLNIISFTGFINYRYNWPYHSDMMNIFFNVLTGIFMWNNFCLLIAKILESTEFTGALQIYFLGLPLIVGLIIFSKDERVELLLKNINNFKKGEEVALQIRYFLQLVHSKDQDRKNAIILKGYIYHHEDSCPNSDCQLKLYKQSILQGVKNKKGSKKHNQQSQNLDNHQLLLQHAKNMYRIGIQKFPACTSLKIQYAFFLMERLNKKTEALAELTQAEQFSPPFDEQFIIYRYKKMSEDFGDHPGEGNGGGLDVVQKFAYESSFRQCQYHIEKSAQLHLEFWNHLRDDRPDISKLNQCGSKINNSIVVIEQYWSQLQKLNSNVPKALKMYAKFLIEILNDKEAGQELLSRAKDATNIKQNYYDANNANEDSNDISSMTQNGTPCIYVTGDGDKIGLITNCNSGASRIFGYTMSEIKNHNVEKLMPEMYAKNHSKVMDDALVKGPDNIPNKERLVFARHKSGYVFPVWIQLKMVQNASNGIQFVALFKIDKKIISSNIGYVLLNKEKKIQGISSGCMKMMNLDIQKMRRLSQNGIDINKLAPNLFGNEHSEYAFAQKQGGLLDWHTPDFDKTKKPKVTNGRDMKEIKDNESKRLIVSSQKIQFICHLNTIVMGELGEIGWYLKLDPPTDKKLANQMTKKDKDKERLRQPLFQFRYDAENGKFIREIKDSLHQDNATKDPNFVNGQWVQMIQNTHQDDLHKLKNQSDGSSGDEKSEADHEDVKVEVKPVEKTPEQNYSEDLLEKKKNWAKNVKIYRLVNGNFQAKEHDEEIRKQQMIEEEQRRKLLEEEKNSSSVDDFKNNIKSRKALQMAISDKSVPRAITNLRMTMNIVLLALLALAIVEFAVLSVQFNEINSNFNLIQQSYGRISEVQRIAYNMRTLVLMNEGKMTSYQGYSTATDFGAYMITDTQTALSNLYTLQNEISLSSLTLTPAHQALVDSKSVNLYFLEQDNTLKILQFSLTEAVLQVASAIFTASHLNITQFNETEKDVYFITYNGYNDFLSALKLVSKYYVDELILKTTQKNQIALILFITAIGTLIVAIFVLFPVVSSVNQARMQVLSLFVDIPNYHVFALANKCEKFLSTYHEEHNDELESDDGDNPKADDSDTPNQGGLKRGSKAPKNSSQSDKKFFIQFGVVVVLVMAYFAAIYAISNQYIKNVKVITEEMNVVAQAESYYSFAQNVQREMIYNASKPILNDNSYSVAKDTLEQLYVLNEYILNYQFTNRNILSKDFLSQFTSIYQGNLCTNGVIQTTLIPYDCTSFLSNSAIHGLQTVLVRYFETLKETLRQYLVLKNANQSVIPLFNNENFLELYIIQFRFIQDAFRNLVQTLTDSVNTEFSTKQSTIMAAFIVFIICVVVGYLILWMPFVTKLNKEIWRTKSMLTIIPIEVILKIPRIQEFLHNQSFFSNKTSGT